MVAQCGADGRQAAGSHIREVVECPVIEAVVVDRSPVAPFATLEPSEPVARLVAEVDFVQPRVMADKGQPGLAVIQRLKDEILVFAVNDRLLRSEERRVGKKWVRTFRTR